MRMDVTYADPGRLIAWAERRIPHCHFRDDAKAIGIIRPSGELAGVFVYDTFSPYSCQMHVASDGTKHWLGENPRDVLMPVFSYPFVQCGFRHVVSLISEHNRPSLRLAAMLGGKREGALREEGPNGEDLVIMGMLQRECRWLPKTLLLRTGQQRRVAV